jgi:GNAT superfamily N-acetyltransferase
MTEYRALTVKEIDAAGALLGRAFRNSPSYAAILAHLDDDRRARAIAHVKTGFTSGSVRYELTDSAWVDGRLAAVALMTAPNHWPPPLAAFLLHAKGCLPAGIGAIGNFLRADRHMQKHHLKEPHYYLFVLGVEPDMQGKGLGKGLLSRMSERADAEAMPCYLETDKPENVRLYESGGYIVISVETVTTKPGFRMWTMRRAVRAS